LTELVDEQNATVESPARELDLDRARIEAFGQVFLYVCVALGIPGNILSAIIWLRLRRKNSSAVYLAAIAINDLVYLSSNLTYNSLHTFDLHGKWFFYCVEYLATSSVNVERLLVLAFSVERLLAICWPLKVGLRLSCLYLSRAKPELTAEPTLENHKVLAGL